MDSIKSECNVQVSFLKARDPSILAYNRHANPHLKVDLGDMFKDEPSSSSVPSSGAGDMQDDDKIKVYLRVKPTTKAHNFYQIQEDDQTLKVTVPPGCNAYRNLKRGDKLVKLFKFSHIFNQSVAQTDLFNCVTKAKIVDFINGKNCTLMTYGASGSGKTFTLIGTVDEPGILPRSLEYLFRTLPAIREGLLVKPLGCGKVKILSDSEIQCEVKLRGKLLNSSHLEPDFHAKTYRTMQQRLHNESGGTVDYDDSVSLGIWVSFAEIYNENIYDLLQPPPRPGQPRPRLSLANMGGRCYIKDLSYVNVKSGVEAYELLQFGLQNVNYAATRVNVHSSRSHCIFTVKLVQTSRPTGNYRVSSFSFCDLAGSERNKCTRNVGVRLQESNKINTSLMVLGRCISALVKAQTVAKKPDFKEVIPFRESKLTQLFQRTLCEGEGVKLLITINPSVDSFDESQRTLDFSALAKEVLIEQPSPKKLSRFSVLLQQNSNADLSSSITSTSSEDSDYSIGDLRDENRRLREAMADMEISARQILDTERQHLISECMKQVAQCQIKERRIRQLERQLAELKNTDPKENHNVICISDSDDEEDEGSKKVVDSLKRKFNDIIIEHEECKKTINLIELENKELKLTLEDALREYRELEKECQRHLKDKVELGERLDEYERPIDMPHCDSSSEGEEEKDDVESKNWKFANPFDDSFFPS